MAKALEALERINEIILPYSEAKHGYLTPRDVCSKEFEIIKKELNRLEKIDHDMIYQKYMELDLKYRGQKEALEIIKESIGIKMSVDEDIGCLYVPITKCFQPLEQNIVVVGFVQGKDKIDLLKGWLE